MLESALPHMHRGAQGEAKKEQWRASHHDTPQPKRHNTAGDQPDTVPRFEVTHGGSTLSWLGPHDFNAIIVPVWLVILNKDTPATSRRTRQ
jgi:hypothetical protein